MKNDYSSPKYYLILLIILVAIAVILASYLYLTLNPKTILPQSYIISSTSSDFLKQKYVRPIPNNYKFSSSKLGDIINIPLDLGNLEITNKCSINVYDYFNDNYYSPKQAFVNGQFIRITDLYELTMQDKSRERSISMKYLKFEENIGKLNPVKNFDTYILKIEDMAFARYKEIMDLENPSCTANFSKDDFDFSYSFGKKVGMEIGIGTQSDWNTISISLYQKHHNYKLLDEFTILGLYTFDSFGNLYSEYYPYLSKDTYQLTSVSEFKTQSSTFVLQDILPDTFTASTSFSIPDEMNITSYEFIYIISNGSIKPFLKIDAEYTSLFYELK